MSLLEAIKQKKLKKRAPSVKPNVYETKIRPLWEKKDVKPGFDINLFTGLLNYHWGGFSFKESKSTLRELMNALRGKSPFDKASRSKLDSIPAAKQRKYITALGYLKNCIDANAWGVTNPYKFEVVQNSSIQIKKDNVTQLTIHKILGHSDNGFPDFSAPRKTTNADKEYIKNVGIAAVRAVRALLCLGTLNNQMKTKDGWMWICNGNPKELNEGHTLARNIAGWVENLAENFEGLSDQNPMMKQLNKTAGYSYGARLMGGGVCAHCSLVTLGVLTTIATDIEACSVYSDKNCGGFDHNFVLARKGNSGWWAIDPWPGQSYVLPWEDCSFRNTKSKTFGLGNCTRAVIKVPVVVPFGVGFTDNNIDKASQGFKFNVARKYQTEEGWTWRHESNKRSGSHKMVAKPSDWGKKILLPV